MSSTTSLDLCILKTIITNKKAALEFASEYDAKLFNSDVWNFANVIINYVKTHKEIPTLRILTEKLSKNEKVVDHVRKIWEQVESIQYDEKEYHHDLDKIKKRFSEKQIISIKDNFSKIESGSIDVNKIINDMQKTIQTINGLNNSKSYERKTLKEALPGFVEKFNAKRLNPKIDEGIKTGYSFFDYATRGVRPADFVIIAGESGFGKSLFLNNIAIQTWLQQNTIESTEFSIGKNIIYFSLEMPYEDCFNRLLSRLSGVPSSKIETAKLNKEEFEKIKKVLDFIKAYPYDFEIVDVADASANDLELILNEKKQQYDVVFIDYIGIMKTNEHNDDADWLKQGIISYETRAIARKYKLPIFTAVQLNRKSNVKESSENIGLSRLARSATIATHATTVIQIESRNEEEKKSDFIYHLIKNRKGPKGKGVLIKKLDCAALFDHNENEESPYEFKNIDDISEQVDKLEL